MYKFQVYLVDYKLLDDNKIAMKFSCSEQLFAYCITKINSSLMKEFANNIAFAKELYSEELDLDNIKEYKRLIIAHCELDKNKKLIVVGFSKLPSDYLYDDLIELKIIDDPDEVYEQINGNTTQRALF